MLYLLVCLKLYADVCLPWLQLFSALSGLLMGALRLQPLRPPPSVRQFATQLLPITAASAATMYFGNMSYLYLSVAFIQILKVRMPHATQQY